MADYKRVHNPDLTEHYIYRLLGKRGRVLYIGCSMTPDARIAEHRRNHLFGHLIVTDERFGPYTYTEGRKIERQWIQVEQPKFNVEWTRRDQRGVSFPNRRVFA